MKLKDKVAIVTGGGAGIGRGISLRYGKEGAKVVVADLSEENAKKVAGEIEAAGGKAFALKCNVAIRSEIKSVVRETVETLGGIDILVNNAGMGKIIPFMDTTYEDFKLMFDINCAGLMFFSQEVGKVMIEQGRGGKIINMASQAGRRGESLVMAYCATKAAVISMNQSIALAFAEHKINVNALAPGIVDTPFWEKVDEQFAKILGWEKGEPKRKFTEGIPLGRIEQPDDLAGAAVFFASSDSDYITQQCLNVDGGNWPS